MNLTEPETKSLLALAGLPVPKEHVVHGASDAARAAAALGFPAVLKIVSPDIPHKSDVGGVRVGLASPLAVERAYLEIESDVRAACPGARIDGMLVQPQLRGVEVIVGATTDEQFGPVMVFGLGGTAVEALGDVAFRLVPLDEHDARAMFGEIRAASLLDGFRGSPPASKDAIVRALLVLSSLVARFADQIAEIEINPLLVTAEQALVVDALAVLSPGAAA